MGRVDYLGFPWSEEFLLGIKLLTVSALPKYVVNLFKLNARLIFIIIFML